MYSLNITKMKELSLEEMEKVEGGDAPSCVFAVAGIVGIGFLIAFPPAGIAAYGITMSATMAGITTGWSIGGCLGSSGGGREGQQTY